MGKRELTGSKRKAKKSEARSKSARNRFRPANKNTKPTWPVVGSIVDYCAIIGAPPTERALVVRSGPDQMGIGEWCVWLEGKPSAVSVLACRPAEADDSPAEVQTEILAAEVGQHDGVWQRYLDGDPLVDHELHRIGALGTVSLGALSTDAGHAYMEPPPRWTPGEFRDYWAGWLAREMAMHDESRDEEQLAQLASAMFQTHGDELPPMSRGHEGDKCEGCGLPIREGEDVLRYADDVVTHAHCPEEGRIAEQTRHDVAASVARHSGLPGRVPYAEDQMELPVVSAPVLPPLTPEEDRAEDAMATADCALMAGVDEEIVDRELVERCGLVRFEIGESHEIGADCPYLGCIEDGSAHDDDESLTSNERAQVYRILSDVPSDDPPPMSAEQYEAARLAEPDCRDEDGAP